MASLLCRNCNTGMHYHSEPNGIQYIYISKEDWKIICNSKFNPKQKQYNGVYPMLFRTDTIESDFEEKVVEVWRCPNCGNVIEFDNVYVKNIYSKSEDKNLGEKISEGYAFVDYLWDKIVEEAKPNEKLKEQLPSYYIKIYEKGFIVSKDELFSRPINYKRCEYENVMESAK